MNLILWVWNLIPWYVQLGAIGYVAFTSIGGTLSLYNWTRTFAGKWSLPAMLSLVIPAGLWLLSFIGRRPDDRHEHVAGRDAEMPNPVRKLPAGKEGPKSLTERLTGRPD